MGWGWACDGQVLGYQAKDFIVDRNRTMYEDILKDFEVRDARPFVLVFCSTMRMYGGHK
jgi:hypothetical protein